MATQPLPCLVLSTPHLYSRAAWSLSPLQCLHRDTTGSASVWGWPRPYRAFRQAKAWAKIPAGSNRRPPGQPVPTSQGPGDPSDTAAPSSSLAPGRCCTACASQSCVLTLRTVPCPREAKDSPADTARHKGQHRDAIVPKTHTGPLTLHTPVFLASVRLLHEDPGLVP